MRRAAGGLTNTIRDGRPKRAGLAPTHARRGRETPAGIFSIIQKEAEHYSNLYDDAYMPHMQRITWSGIALHGGPLPGYPASHGCVRMPYDFAERLFDVTRLGMRVIVAPIDVAPVEIAHPALFTLRSDIGAVAAASAAEADEANQIRCTKPSRRSLPAVPVIARAKALQHEPDPLKGSKIKPPG